MSNSSAVLPPQLVPQSVQVLDGGFVSTCASASAVNQEGQYTHRAGTLCYDAKKGHPSSRSAFYVAFLELAPTLTPIQTDIIEVILNGEEPACRWPN